MSACYTVMEVLLKQDSEENYKVLEKLLLDDLLKHIRIKQSIARKFIETGRKLHNTDAFKVGFMHPDLVIKKIIL